MRDIIWTIIVVWLIYKVVEVFRIATAKRSANIHSNQTNTHSASRPEKDIKNAVKKHLNNEGEYIDFEEVK